MRQVLFFCLERARVWWLEVRAWASPGQNPFVAQALRAGARRSLALRLAFWFGAWFVAAWGMAVGVESSLGHEVEVPVVGAQTALGLSWVWALWIARVRLSWALQKEWLKQRLVPILLSRLSPEEVAALSGAPAVLLGLFVSALTLPAWALGLGLGFLTPLDAWGYAMLLLVACVGFPSWSAATWEAQLNARAGGKAATGKTTVRPTSSTATSVGAALFLSLFPVEAALFCVASRPFIASFATWVSLWPPEITMLFGHLHAFPLLLARLLVYPLPFYAASLPLWIALAPFWVNGLRSSHARLSCALEARRDSEHKRARRVAAIWRPVRGWWAPLLAGFALPVAYHDGWLAAWRGSTVMFPSKWGVGADVTLSWWHILIALGTFTFSICLRSRARASGGRSWAQVRVWCGKRARTIGAGVVGAGILGPLLCGHNPCPVPLAGFLVQMALVAGTWLMIQLALARENAITAKSHLVSPQHAALSWLVPLWMFGGPVLLAGVPFALSWGTVFISPLSWPYCLMSPATLWFAPRFEWSLTSPLFYGVALLHLALAGALYLRARTLRAPVAGGAKTKTKRQTKAQKQAIIRRAALQRATSQAQPFVESAKQTLADAPLQPLADASPQPLADASPQTLADARRTTLAALALVLEARQRAASEAQTFATAPRNAKRKATKKKAAPEADSEDALEINTPQTAALRTATRSPLPTPTAQQRLFLERFARFDNAVLLLELRRAMGKTEWTTAAREGAKIGALLIVFFSILIPAIVIGFCLLIGAGPSPGPGSPTFTDMEWMFCAAVAGGLLLTGVEVCQKVEALYDRDRLDGSLDFLFLTPLRTREIVAGKIAPPLLRGACFFAAFWPALLTIALLLSLGGDHRLWPLAAVVPPVMWALAARVVLWLHLAGVAKPNSKLVVLAAAVGLCALPLAIAGSVGFAASNAPAPFSPATWETPVVLLLLALIPACWLDCLCPFLWSVRVLERERVRR